MKTKSRIPTSVPLCALLFMAGAASVPAQSYPTAVLADGPTPFNLLDWLMPQNHWNASNPTHLEENQRRTGRTPGGGGIEGAQGALNGFPVEGGFKPVKEIVGRGRGQETVQKAQLGIRCRFPEP